MDALYPFQLSSLSPTHRSNNSPVAILLSVNSSDNAYRPRSLVRVAARADLHRHAMARTHAYAHGSGRYRGRVAASN